MRAVLASDLADCSLKYSQILLRFCWPKATVLCPAFVPLSKWFSGKGDTREHRGRQETGRFYWCFLFCSGKPEGKDRSGGERSNPLSYAGLNKIAGFKEVLRNAPFLTLFVTLVNDGALSAYCLTPRFDPELEMFFVRTPYTVDTAFKRA